MGAVAERTGVWCGIEMALWLNGALLSYPITHSTYMSGQSSVSLPDPKAPAWGWRLDLVWDGEPMTNWFAYRAQISNANGYKITNMAPGLLFKHPWSVYSVLTVPSVDPALPGMITLGMRMAGKLDGEGLGIEATLPEGP